MLLLVHQLLGLLGLYCQLLQSIGVWCVYSFGVVECVHSTSLNKDSSNGMKSRNKDVSDSFSFGSNGGNLVLEDFRFSQSFAKLKNTVSVVCLSMNLYSWQGLILHYACLIFPTSDASLLHARIIDQYNLV